MAQKDAFKVGQKVICISSDTNELGALIGIIRKDIIKGTTLTVRKCREVCVWFEEVVNPSQPELFAEPGDNGEPAYHARNYAPIEETSVSIPESLKEQAKELIEVKETIQEPEMEPA